MSDLILQFVLLVLILAFFGGQSSAPEKVPMSQAYPVPVPDIELEDPWPVYAAKEIPTKVYQVKQIQLPKSHTEIRKLCKQYKIPVSTRGKVNQATRDKLLKYLRSIE